MDQMRGRAEAGAKRGYLTASIDCRYHGRRCPPGEDKRNCYEHALVRSGSASSLLAQRLSNEKRHSTRSSRLSQPLFSLYLQGIAADMVHPCYHALAIVCLIAIR